MTEFELKQPFSVFIQAGRSAYRILVHISNNPYKRQPFRDLWDKGWRQERRKDIGLPPKEPKTFEKRPHTKWKSVRHKSDIAAPKRIGYVKKPAQPKEPVITNRLVERFNRRHQTVA